MIPFERATKDGLPETDPTHFSAISLPILDFFTIGGPTLTIVRRACPGTPSRKPHEHPPSPVLFLDRDGVINVDKGYVFQTQEFELLPDVQKAVELAKEREVKVIVVTNQSGIGRGYYTEQDFLQLTEHMLTLLPVDAVYYCPHDPDVQCPARKPGTGQILAATTDFHVSLDNSILIGDKQTDIMAAEACGIEPILYTGQSLLQIVQEWLNKSRY